VSRPPILDSFKDFLQDDSTSINKDTKTTTTKPITKVNKSISQESIDTEARGILNQLTTLVQSDSKGNTQATTTDSAKLSKVRSMSKQIDNKSTMSRKLHPMSAIQEKLVVNNLTDSVSNPILNLPNVPRNQIEKEVILKTNSPDILD